MMARCPKCDDLVEVMPTGRPIDPERGSSTWKLLADHPDPRTGKPCPRSGRVV